MAKYTLGALIAFAIIGVTAFLIIAALNDGKADSLIGKPATIVVADAGPTERNIYFEADRPTELRIENHTTFARVLTYDGAEVEQLSNLPEPPPGGATPPRLYILAEPGKTRAASVRFSTPGTYIMQLGLLDSPDKFTIYATVQ